MTSEEQGNEPKAICIFHARFLGSSSSSSCRSDLSTDQRKHTQVEWTGRKPKGKHDGGFKKMDWVAKITEREGLKLEIEMDCRSIYSDNFLLTQHLKSADFFSVKKFPKATFKSTRVEQISNDNFRVIGELTFLDKQLPIEFPATIEAGNSLSLKAKFTINRRNFGMDYGQGKIDDLVELRVVVDAPRVTSGSVVINSK